MWAGLAALSGPASDAALASGEVATMGAVAASVAVGVVADVGAVVVAVALAGAVLRALKARAAATVLQQDLLPLWRSAPTELLLWPLYQACSWSMPSKATGERPSQLSKPS